MEDFVERLKQRKLVQWALAYAAAAFALIQVLDIVSQRFGWPSALERFAIVAMAVGFFVTLVLAWYHGERGAQKTTSTELLILALLLAIGGVVAWRLVPTPAATQETAAKSALVMGPAAAIPDKSIAVLPLTNESGDKDQQYFSDGLSENLIVTLSQFSGLKVIGRNSSFQFRETKDDSRTIGTKLGVASLLEGSVQRAGDAVRISAELIHAADGSTIWTQHYDRPYKDLFKLQDDIAQSVAGALKAKLLPGDSTAAQTDRPPSGNLDAYTAYLQGNFLDAHNTEADLRQAIEQYTKATHLDPQYALAWAALSQSAGRLASAFLGGAEQQRLEAQSLDASNKALMLEPNLAAAHAARGEVLGFLDFDWSGAEAEFRRALRLAPGNTEATEGLGVQVGARGDPQQAIGLLRQSINSEPMRAAGFMLLSRYLVSVGHIDEADQAIRKAIALAPRSGIFDATLVMIDIQRNDAAAALADAQRALPSPWQDFALAMALQIGGDRASADAALKHLIDKNAEGMAYQIAQVYALRRDPDKAFEWLDRAWANRDTGIQFLLVDRFLLRYRNDPRFAAFCKKVGLLTTTEAKAMP